MTSVWKQSYAARTANFANPAARALLETMERKKTNLSISVDVTKKADLLAVVDAVGPDVCLVKTHIDIVEDFDADLVEQLTALSKKHDFLIFEDRKFADIGNTVSLQYAAGVHKIASWSHITNAHLVPGPGIITGLAEVGLPLGRGLLLLAQMSSAGTLARGEYSGECVRAARADSTGFICGFIATQRVDELFPAEQHAQDGSKDFLVLTPGIGLDVKGDGKGQQYLTPEEVVRNRGSDVIIVGRGIYGALLSEEGRKDRTQALEKVREQAQRYRKAGWEAYLQRLA
ncbi:orotidine 5'-phosphate decarboxylase [Tilletia horrida]|uniref:Orotidine 5'-phosphate decarboxylase n=1 Tax=Tilletia horrida TaxID=155126 RepID=A0AAN6JM47_9BASI|nr:orotidine 5'-phosphate decarboxylase [Tilletia horrida]KAK0528380.1 orotidine 5'-phosphate decarboxylase [Tilletia horrida]KAK0538494.1 orotidine 5'-phosphate decarboxylase [Tilletia horrida]KAK0562239.1 orotidine 5'-phosphate decarboxylase [Tilletia horrida]